MSDDSTRLAPACEGYDAAELALLTLGATCYLTDCSAVVVCEV